MNKITKIILITGGSIAGVIVLAVAMTVLLRVGGGKAQAIALQQTGGGEIVSMEVEAEGLLNEYKYEIINGNHYYEVEVNGFGWITEFEQELGYYR